MVRQIITLTTDFGLKDPYVAEMKATILSVCPTATIVDVSHEIEKFNIKMGAYVLACASTYFPEGTIHVAVVDPSVGTKKHALLVQTRPGFFIGPDNGILSLTAESQDVEHVYSIQNRHFMLARRSSTFHGRDMFAPAAAHLANGVEPKEFGPEIQGFNVIGSNKKKEKRKIIGEVIYTDSFGNIVTNIKRNEVESLGIGDTLDVQHKETRLRLGLRETYAEVKLGRPLALVGSHNLLEVSINRGNAAKALKVKSGDRIVIYAP